MCGFHDGFSLVIFNELQLPSNTFAALNANDREQNLVIKGLPSTRKGCRTELKFSLSFILSL
jgi:hypothetical protein